MSEAFNIKHEALAAPGRLGPRVHVKDALFLGNGTPDEHPAAKTFIPTWATAR
jgi:hypothetical protein